MIVEAIASYLELTPQTKFFTDHFGTEYYLFVHIFVTPYRYNESLLDPPIQNQCLARFIDVGLSGHILYNSHVFINLDKIWYMFILWLKEYLLDPLEPINF